jgi:hypothetical protein
MQRAGKFNRVIGVVATLVIVAGVVAYLYRSKEPSYQGMTLTEWLDKAEAASMAAWGRQEGKPSWETCEQAIRSMGTNAIPFLLKYQTIKENRFEANLREKLGYRLSFRFHMREPLAWRGLAVNGFAALGTNAVDATPALMRIAKSTDRTDSAYALMSLERIHPRKKFIKVLIQLFEDTANPQRAEVGFTLSMRDVETAEQVGVFQAFPKTPRGPKQQPDSYWMRD